MNTNPTKILVALDGSSHSIDAVNYLSHMLPRHDTSLVLFSVYSGRPERFRDIEESLFVDPKETNIEEWENQQKKAIGEFMENSRQVFLDRGFPPDAVTLKIREKDTGIARDIIREAQSGYDAVVAGRQGMNPITRLVIGSVAAKLIASLTDVPLWLVGSGATDAAKILVATDGSENALQAVKYVGRMVSGTEVSVTIFQVIRGFDFRLPGPDARFFTPPDGKAWPNESREAQTVRAGFEKAVNALGTAGIDPRRITTKVVSGVATRSGTIIAQAMTGGYGTIVIGRKGHSKVNEFHMGRVTNKVVQLANKAVVWVVG